MDVVEKSIAGLIERNFPEVYREEGPLFVAFVRAYYDWMETEGQAIYHSRRLPAYRDIDDTVDQFLVYFKETYLKGIQFDTSTNVRQLVKHSLDLYRSKGTDRAIDLFFRLVFGEAAAVYRPGRDLFVLSSGDWVKKRYLEVTPRVRNAFYVGRQVFGVDSGATAFIESLVRRKVGTKYIEVFYISAIRGDFRTGEMIASGDERSGNPIVVGSLSDLIVTSGGQDFAVGDIVEIGGTQSGGQQGLARVTSVSDVTGVVSFVLVDGGWGYTSTPNVSVSETVLTLSGVTTDGMPTTYYDLFETVTQPLELIGYESANGEVVVGDTLTAYDGDDNPTGVGLVLNVEATDSETGNVVVSPVSGNLQSNTTLYTDANAASIEVVSHVDRTASGKVNGIGAVLTMSVTGAVGNLVVGTSAVQSDGLTQLGVGTVLSHDLTGGAGVVRVEVSRGRFLTGRSVSFANTATANVATLSFPIGVVDVTEPFVAYPGNELVADSSNTTGTVSSTSTGTGATFSVSPVLSWPEVSSINTDLLSDYVDVELDAEAYGFPGDPSANLSSVIGDALTYDSMTLGSITLLQSVNPGSDYNFAPFVTVIEPPVSIYDRRDFVATVSNSVGFFVTGELVQQNNGARALVKPGSNTTVLLLKRISFENAFEVGEALVGSSSGAEAVLDSIVQDELATPIGLNAVVSSNVQTATGSVVGLDVVDSGFGYVHDQESAFTSLDGTRSGTARLSVRRQGSAAGYYRDRGGFLSSDKYLHDGLYYQVHSYEVRSGIAFARYADVLRDVLHVAGSRMFGAVFKSSETVSGIDVAESTIEVGV